MRRRSLHRALAEALEAAGAPSREVAKHWLGARAGAQAREALLRAAAESEAVHAHRDAAAADRQALDLWPEHGDEAAPRRGRSSATRAARGWPASWPRPRAPGASSARSTRAAGDELALRAGAAGARRGVRAQGRPRGVRSARAGPAAEAYAANGHPAEAAVEQLAMANQRRLERAARGGDRAGAGRAR